MASYPPLLGDKNGQFRICVVGNSGMSNEFLRNDQSPTLRVTVTGAGKSTTASALSKVLGVPYLSLDTFFWQSGWKPTPNDEMRDKVMAALEECKNGWIVDGNYERRIGDFVQAQATDIIWLDPPLTLYLPRIILRTFLGLIRVIPPCSPGCHERLSKVFFSKQSIVWWCLTQHGPARRRNSEKFKRIGLGVESHVGEGKMRRIGGWGSEYKRWMESIIEMMAAKKVKDD